jgi:hypothetical protein
MPKFASRRQANRRAPDWVKAGGLRLGMGFILRVFRSSPGCRSLEGFQCRVKRPIMYVMLHSKAGELLPGPTGKHLEVDCNGRALALALQVPIFGQRERPGCASGAESNGCWQRALALALQTLIVDDGERAGRGPGAGTGGQHNSKFDLLA